MHFEIGDEVVVTNDTYYRWTRTGSKGIITHIDEDECVIDFYLLTGSYKKEKGSFLINKNNIELVSKSEINKPYYKVISKIRQMDERRKAKGYAF